MRRNAHKVISLKKYKDKLQEREENFAYKKEYFESLGYQSEKVMVNVVYANIISVLILAISSVIMIVCFMSIYDTFQIDLSFKIIGWLIALIIIHEVIHGLTWSLFCEQKWKSIQFGIMWKLLTPYCCCLEVLPWKTYILGGLMPFFVLGVGGYILALWLGSGTVLILSILNVAGAAGDLIVAYRILKNHDGVLLDLPKECGYMRFYKDTL